MSALSKLAQFIGSRVLPFTNPRVVSPPGIPSRAQRPNILVVTPRRSGTHILIDMILNNLPAYRRKPLYIDLDQCWKQSHANRDLLAPIALDAGYVIKTHMPIENGPDLEDPRIRALINSAVIVTVRRDSADIVRSLMRWFKSQPDNPEVAFQKQIDAFWAVWDHEETLDIHFHELFDPVAMQSRLSEIAIRCDTKIGPNFKGPALRGQPNRIYLRKLATRLLGAKAPRIDTTIHTLK